MATATRRRPKQKRMKQQFIPGTEPETFPAVDDAAENYHEVKTERVKLSKEEGQAKDNLIDKMKEHGLNRYETPDGLVVVVTATSNVKTKRRSKADENGEAEEAE